MGAQHSADDPRTASAQGTPPFGEVLTRWREHRAMSKKKLAAAMGFDPSYVSHVEAGRHPASEDFVRKADSVLSADGSLWQTWRADGPSRAAGASTGASNVEGLVVEEDHARLEYDGTTYRPMQRRRLFNGGAEPVTRYLIRISVDRYPGRPDRSNALYRTRPLTWDELALTATCGGEPMNWRPKQDRDSFKEAWLCLDNDRGRFPLYPGQHSTIEYGYQVDDGRWGPWFQRAVRLPTRRLSVELVFPAELDPVVWGTETSTTAEAVPLRTPITRTEGGDRLVFSWATQDPPMGARYRLEWRFRARDGDADQPRPELRTASDRMKAAVIAPPDPDAEPLVLLNPRVINASPETDEQYEGCLSFFDVRGLVPRPLRLEVAHTRLDGQSGIVILNAALARLAGHEIDHLYGRLYTDRMRDGIHPIPVENYRGTGRAWSYR
ncbi:hypothetical protein GCM10022254_27950 [Actinomadura meridiana]|uniref:HTH cro/C1-type domain-containing protein n=1 Tax=Actinomadura meridiana TaxID=559626 RepID=A0ABP8C0L6_9ACTN